MSNPFNPPSILSPMNYSRAALVLGLFLAILGLFTPVNGGAALIGVGGLLLIMSGMMNDIQRNFVGLVLLTHAKNAGDDVLQEISEALHEIEKRLKTLETRTDDLHRQHNPIVDEIETLQVDVDNLKRDLAKARPASM